MGHYLKTFFITYLLLFTFASNSVAQETASRETISALNTGESDVCFDLIVDISPLDHPLHDIFDSEDAPKGYSIDVSESSLTRLELLFTLRRPGTLATFKIIGVGESGATEDTVKEAVRDGYGQLRDLLEDFRQPRSEINAVQDDRALVPLGRSDHIQEFDVFHIYPRVDYYNACSDVSYSPLSALAIARVVRMDNTSSILEINVIPDGGRSVQVGDIVRLSSEIDFSSRLQANASFRSVLQFNIPRIYTVRDTGNRKIWTKLTRFINGFLTTEAPRGVQVFTNAQ